MQRTLTAAVLGFAAQLALAACSASNTDFKKSAEDFIESKEVESKANTTFTDATCTSPAKVEKGQTFTCTAVDASGGTWDFSLEITSSDHFVINSGQPRG